MGTSRTMVNVAGKQDGREKDGLQTPNATDFRS